MASAQTVEGLNQWRATIVSDPQLAKIRESYIGGEPEIREPGDAVRLRMLLVNWWSLYETSFYANQYGLLGASEWSRHESQLCVRYHFDLERRNRFEQGGVDRGAPSLRSLMTEEFATYVESSCEHGDQPATSFASIEFRACRRGASLFVG